MCRKYGIFFEKCCRICSNVISLLSSFGCRILAYDLYHDPSVELYADYAELETVLRESDVVTLHMPANQLTYHLLNKATLSYMKKDAFVVNTGRGTLIDTDALIETLKEKKIGGAALDVLEEEKDIFYQDMQHSNIPSRQVRELRKLENVMITPHVAFHTTRAVHDMIENAVQNCIRYEKNRKSAQVCG